uniref:Ig-like domain-containing protein n=1 Tax=Steinernema glaseri TaxID=37863 RepID=A0A1I8AFE8_9BILA
MDLVWRLCFFLAVASGARWVHVDRGALLWETLAVTPEGERRLACGNFEKEHAGRFHWRFNGSSVLPERTQIHRGTLTFLNGANAIRRQFVGQFDCCVRETLGNACYRTQLSLQDPIRSEGHNVVDEEAAQLELVEGHSYLVRLFATKRFESLVCSLDDKFRLPPNVRFSNGRVQKAHWGASYYQMRLEDVGTENAGVYECSMRLRKNETRTKRFSVTVVEKATPKGTPTTAPSAALLTLCLGLLLLRTDQVPIALASLCEDAIPRVYLSFSTGAQSFPSSSPMNAVPAAFVDALCATLKKTDLKELLEIGRPWWSTVATHCSRRRNLDLYVHINDEEDEVRIGLVEGTVLHSIHSAAFCKDDRIVRIRVEDGGLSAFPDRVTVHYFRTHVLPVLKPLANNYDLDVDAPVGPYGNVAGSLFSSLCGHVRELRTCYTGEECVEFIEKQADLGQLERLCLRGTEWPESVTSALMSFLKSKHFESLDLSHANVTLDLAMAKCFLGRFLNGDLSKKAVLCGKPSFRPSALECVHQPSTIVWTGPGAQKLRALFTRGELLLNHL